MARATGFNSLKNEENKEIKSEKMDRDVVEIKKAVGFGDSTTSRESYRAERSKL